MDFERDSTNTDEYFVTALQIFDCCGVESSGSLRVDSLMDKLVPAVKTNKAEFGNLKTLLDPEHSDPDISVTKLANALHKYSESQKTKMELDESFNLKSGHGAQDSDSGISSDGLQILEELQSELKEKEHLAYQLRSQLDYSDRHHEEELLALKCERDTLKTQLNIAREETATLTRIRKDYDEACERLCASETALADVKRDADILRKRVKVCQDHVAQLESDKVTLQEQLSKSKEECHRINEMYASRQSALLEDNETVRAQHAELSARLRDQEHCLHQIIQEKVQLEMELKDLLNKSNQNQLRLDHSIEVSYTEDQMLTALDTLNADSRFSTENRILDEDSFLSALKEDQGRPTNLSLFDEIRLSFCNMSRITLSDINVDKNALDHSLSSTFVANIGTQTDNEANEMNAVVVKDNCRLNDTEDTFEKIESIDIITVSAETQTDDKCHVEIKKHDSETQTDTNKVDSKGVQTLGRIIIKRPFGKHRPFPKANVMKKAIEAQADNLELETKPKEANTVETQTEPYQACNINNNTQNTKCVECENARRHTDQLETSLKCSNLVMTEVKLEIEKYEHNLELLQSMIDEGKDKNRYLQTVVRDLTSKIEILRAVIEKQGEVIDKALQPEGSSVSCQTDIDVISVSTQAEVPCAECDKRAVVPHSSLRKFFWEPLKCLFQLFAIVCFVCAVCVLCGVAPGRGARGECRAAPWRWLHSQDIMDLLFRVEYTAEVPM